MGKYAYTRTMKRSIKWFRGNRPSGLVMVIMTAFIVSYVVIIKLDSDYKRQDNASLHKLPEAEEEELKYVQDLRDLPGSSGKDIHFKEGLVVKTATIPQDILDDFAEDADRDPDAEEIDYKDDADEEEDNVDDKSKDIAINLETENEMMINTALDRNEDEIEDAWDKFLDQGKGKAKDKAKETPNVDQQHLRLQGVRSIQKPVVKRPTYNNLPKFVQKYDVFKESKKDRESISKNKCVLLKTMFAEAPICIHDPDMDEIISGSLMRKGTWEPNYLYLTGSILRLYSDMMFLDLGCNIGVYTIFVAKLGHTVVSVDPYKKNLRLLTKSLSLGSLQDRVTLLWNAISDVHENVTVNSIIGNIGGTFVETSNNDDATGDYDLATTIILDDLVDMFRDKSVFVKMDVEAFELKALEGGPDFFKKVDVRYVLMEWIAHKNSPTADQIIKTMQIYGLVPHINAHHNTKLLPENSGTWPDNVLWIKY